MNTPFTSPTNCKLQMYKASFLCLSLLRGFCIGDIISIFPRYSLCDISLIFPMRKPLYSPNFGSLLCIQILISLPCKKKERTREKICEPNLHTGYHNQLRARDILVPIKFSFRSDRRFLGCDVQRRHLRVCRDHLFTLVVF